MNRTRCIAAAIVVAVAATGSRPAGDPPPLRPQMESIFEALSTALNLSLYDSPFRGDQERAMITDALELLADSAAALEIHAPGYEYLERSLARDAREAALRYRQGREEGATFLLTRLTASCMGCHTRLPADQSYDLGHEFVRRARIESLPPLRRARLLVAVREFEPAMDVYEDYFRSGEVLPQEMAADGSLPAYLTLALRVLDEDRRARKTLERLSGRDDCTPLMSRRIAQWVGAIRRFDAGVADRTPVATARRLIHEAGAADHPGTPARDGDGLAGLVLASRCLLRYLDAHRDDAGLPEVYYLLGVCESGIAVSPWVSETEFYLEAAVRADPSSAFAGRAVDFLESYVREQYMGSGGVMVPEDVRARIEGLRRLLVPSPPPDPARSR